MQSSSSSVATATTVASTRGSSTTKSANFYPKKIFLHVSPSTTESSLTSEASTYGQVRSVRIPTDKQGRSRGFAFVTFRWSEDAEQAIQGLDGTKLDGLVLRDIRWATNGNGNKNKKKNDRKKVYKNPDGSCGVDCPWCNCGGDNY